MTAIKALQTVDLVMPRLRSALGRCSAGQSGYELLYVEFVDNDVPEDDVENVRQYIQHYLPPTCHLWRMTPRRLAVSNGDRTAPADEFDVIHIGRMKPGEYHSTVDVEDTYRYVYWCRNTRSPFQGRITWPDGEITCIACAKLARKKGTICHYFPTRCHWCTRDRRQSP